VGGKVSSRPPHALPDIARILYTGNIPLSEGFRILSTLQDLPDDVMMGQATHKILEASADMQRIPTLGIAALMLIPAALVALCWRDLEAGALVYAVALANWALLWLLRSTERSLGPEKASAVGLALLSGLPVALLGILGAPGWLAVGWLILIAFCAFYATWIEPFALRVTHERKQIANWDSDHPLQVLHLGDLHAEHFGPRERRLNALIADLKPDLIVFSGDFINLSYVDNPRAIAAVKQVIQAWKAPLGLLAIPGTPVIDSPERTDAYLAEMPWATPLFNDWAHVKHAGGTLSVAGVVTSHILMPTGGASLLLAHAPDIAPEAAEAGFDLMFSGHTHGGQLCLPGGFALLTGSHLGRRFVRGRVEVGKTSVYTTTGIGMEGLGAPRARFFCPPQIILWEITGC
jgi:predicted MPP superfamily phosphohydrolase